MVTRCWVLGAGWVTPCVVKKMKKVRNFFWGLTKTIVREEKFMTSGGEIKIENGKPLIDICGDAYPSGEESKRTKCETAMTELAVSIETLCADKFYGNTGDINSCVANNSKYQDKPEGKRFAPWFNDLQKRFEAASLNIKATSTKGVVDAVLAAVGAPSGAPAGGAGGAAGGGAPSGGSVSMNELDKTLTGQAKTNWDALKKSCDVGTKSTDCLNALEGAMGQIDAGKHQDALANWEAPRSLKVKDKDGKEKVVNNIKALEEHFKGFKTVVTTTTSAWRISVAAGGGIGSGTTNPVTPMGDGSGLYSSVTNPECSADFGCPPGGRGISSGSGGPEESGRSTVSEFQLPRVNVEALARLYFDNNGIFAVGGAYARIFGQSTDQNVYGKSGDINRYSLLVGGGYKFSSAFDLIGLIGLDISDPTAPVDFGADVGFREDTMWGIPLELRGSISLGENLRLMLAGGGSVYPTFLNRLDVDGLRYEGAGMDEFYGKLMLEYQFGGE